jgi:CRP-like cAMP-binding protein
MDRQALRERLSAIAFSAELPDDVVDEIIAAAAPASFPRGTVIFREGSTDRNLYLLMSGRVALEMLVPAQGPVRLLSLGPGDMLAWSALLGEGRMTATAIAVEDTEAIAISAERLLEICQLNAQVGYELMRRMALALSKRLLATRLQLLDLFSAEAPLTRS